SCVILLSVSHLFGQAFKNPPEGAAALSQAGVFIAQSDDASAIVHNPAGLVQREGQQFILGSAFLYPVTEVKTTAYKGNSEETIAYLPYIFFSTDTGKGSPLHLGIGITFPYGQSTEWSKTAVRNWGYTVPYYSAMQTMNISPVVAYKITPSLSAGAGLNIYNSKLNMKYLVPVSPPVPPLEFSGKLDVDGTTTGWTAGLLYRQERYSIGLRYKSDFKIEYDGDFKMAGTELPAEMEINFPDNIGIGIAFFPNDRLKIELDGEWFGYSSIKRIPVSISGFPPYIEKNWDDIYTIALGTEYKNSDRIKLRGGIIYIPTPIPDSTWDPSLPDADSFVITGGGEFSTRIGIFNLLTGIHIFDERNIEKGAPYDGEYQSTGYFINLEYKRQF
ncbi:MAG: outer membrane protein transport protein, partial [Candidatus Omnitrophica bacterium]|nr:outer membrane protein transport protein [Candidatus Omnitrophota bacterium]